MSCQRLDALFYCLFRKAGVDLASLANMSQQQQQSLIYSSTAAAFQDNEAWNSITKQDKILNNEVDNILMSNVNFDDNACSTNSLSHPSNDSNFNVIKYQQHCNSIVPAQIQVQIQVQVCSTSKYVSNVNVVTI